MPVPSDLSSKCIILNLHCIKIIHLVGELFLPGPEIVALIIMAQQWHRAG